MREKLLWEFTVMLIKNGTPHNELEVFFFLKIIFSWFSMKSFKLQISSESALTSPKIMSHL